MRKMIPTPLLLASALALAACGGGPEFAAGGRPLPTPEERGVYVLTPGGELARVDGSPEWERGSWPARSDFGPEIEFIVRDPALAGGSGQGEAPVKLWRVAWLRSELQTNGRVAPAQGSKWVVAPLERLRAPLRATAHPGIPEIRHYTPAQPLAPGLYELQVESAAGRSRTARVGVRWSSVDQRDYASAHCVDRVAADERAFRPCDAGRDGSERGDQRGRGEVFSSEPAGAPPLRIALGEPAREDGGLRVRGTVRNLSASVQPAPMLRATVRDAAGRPLESWVFPPPERRIAPGGRMPFETRGPAPEGASRLDMDFVPEDRRAALQ
ncbi:MAG: hypothetical protein ACQEUZ_04425 [Pseudomonadota bacterium]